MTWRPRQLALVLSAAVTGVGALATFLLLLQPWASCPTIDDTSAGCPVEGAQAVAQAVAMLVVLVGALATLGCLLWPPHPGERARTGAR